MTTPHINTANTEGIDFNATYTAYDQTAAITSTNDPSIPAPPFRVGTTVKGSADSDFVFVKASSAIALGDVCIISQTTAYNAAPMTTTTGTFGNLIGVAQVAIASGSYGWLQRAGSTTNVNTVGGTGPAIALYTTATGGTIASATTTGTKLVSGIILVATNTAAATAAYAGVLNYPVVGATN